MDLLASATNRIFLVIVVTPEEPDDKLFVCSVIRGGCDFERDDQVVDGAATTGFGDVLLSVGAPFYSINIVTLLSVAA